MLALKNLDTDLTKSETRTLIGFGLIYSFLVVIILSIISFLYYQFQEDLILQEKRPLLQKYSNEFISKLKDLHINFDKTQIYPRDERFQTAIYDSDEREIFSTLKIKNKKLHNITYIIENKIHYIKEPESYYLGAKYIIIEINDDGLWFNKVKKNLLIFFPLGFVFMGFIGYFIAKLFLKPMRDALHLLDKFIKDTTHELNTPISAIISNIEMIDKTNLDEKILKKINRIEIGAKTISNIYEDLTFITLNNKIISQNENLNLSKLLYQRVEFFESLIQVKRLSFETNIEDDIYMFTDVKKISKLVDNLISNAIKYNKPNGKIKIELKENLLIIEDIGKGISNKNIQNLFDRYSRFDNSVGGFGIGLNIVSLIAKEYNLKIEITSEINIGTRVEVIW